MRIPRPPPRALPAPAAFCVLLMAASFPVRAAAPQNAVRVLFVSSYDSDSAETSAVVAAFERELAFQGIRPEVFMEFVDIHRIPQTEASRTNFDDNLRARYAEVRFDVILAQASDALRAVARYRGSLPYRPPVYCFDWIDPALAETFSGTEGFYGRALPMSFPPPWT